MNQLHPVIQLSRVRTHINGLKQTEKELIMEVAELMGDTSKMIVESDVLYENAVFLVWRNTTDICCPQDIKIEKIPLVKKTHDLGTSE